MLHNIKPLYLHCVFHGIRFKVNNEDWLSVMDSHFCVYRVLLKMLLRFSDSLHLPDRFSTFLSG